MSTTSQIHNPSTTDPHRRKKSRLWALTLPAVALLAAACGVGDAISFHSSGEQIDVGGREIFLRCEGTGSPTIILEHGLASNGLVWQNVQGDLADNNKVCLTSRAGMVFSDPVPGDDARTAQDAVDDLVKVLDVADIPGPYVMVGHSFGGYVVRLFADQHPDDVVGMVLVDASHEDQSQRFQEIVSAEAWSETGLLYNAGNSERMDFTTSGSQVAATGPLGDLPLAVLEAGDNNPEADDEVGQAIADLWPGFQLDLAALSTNSSHTVVADSGHFIQNDQPEAVIEAVRSVL